MADYSDRTKEEITITGITVYYNMISRVNNPFQLGGALFAKTGPLDANAADVRMQNVSAQKIDAQANAAADQPASNDAAVVR